MADISSLAFEDITWHLECTLNSDDDEDDEDTHKTTSNLLISVVDGRGSTLSSVCSSHDAPSCKDLMNVIHDALTSPLSGKPRRPRYFDFKRFQPVLLEDFKNWGITVLPLEHSAVVRNVFEDVTVRTCHFCRRRGSSELFMKCPECAVVFYCNHECLTRSLDADGTHSHRFWCQAFSQYAELAKTLADLPFTFAALTTADDFTEKKRSKFLQDTKCSMNSDQEHCYGAESLLEQLCNQMKSPRRQSDAISDWNSYFEWNCLPLDVPYASYLSLPLTIYFIVTQLFAKNDSLHWEDVQWKQKFNIHLLAIRHEIHLRSLFTVLSDLLPGLNFELNFIGNEIPHSLKAIDENVGTCHFKSFKGFYHQFQAPPPDIIIGLNAGLSADRNWNKTLLKVKQMDVPCYITDFCRMSCELSKEPIQDLLDGSISEPIINPFRCPLRRYCEEHLLPWYSNAFIFKLLL